MVRLPRLRRLWDSLMSFGAFSGETDIQRGKRRIVVGYFVFGVPPRLLFGAAEMSEGVIGEGVVDLSAALISIIGLIVLRLKPEWFLRVVNAALFFMLVEVLAVTLIYGGLIESQMIIMFGLITVVGALIVLSVGAAFGWFLAFLFTAFLGVVLPERIAPLYVGEGSSADIAGVLLGATIFVYAGMAYFVRQRDRFQKESDDLLHNILPDTIARRLKTDKTMIADDYESASVLFADVVGFTPMSALLSPPELVGLLNTCSPHSTGSLKSSAWRRSKPLVTNTWPPPVCPRNGPTMLTLLPSWRCGSATTPPTTNSTAATSACGSASTQDRW